MMLLPALFVLFAVPAALPAAIEELHECGARAIRIKCGSENTPDEMPDTMEDLIRDCKVLYNTEKCLLEENDKCEEKPFDSVFLRKIVQFMEMHCYGESSIRQAISRNYECIKPIIENMGQCRYCSEEKWEELFSMSYGDRDSTFFTETCQYKMCEITCTASSVNLHCGQEAKEAVTEILQKMLHTFHACDNEMSLRALQPMREIIESTFTNATLEETENSLPE